MTRAGTSQWTVAAGAFANDGDNIGVYGLFHFERGGRCLAGLPSRRVQQYPGAVVGVVNVAAADAFEALRGRVRRLATGVGDPSAAQHVSSGLRQALRVANSDLASGIRVVFTGCSSSAQAHWKPAVSVARSSCRTCSLMPHTTPSSRSASMISARRPGWATERFPRLQVSSFRYR